MSAKRTRSWGGKQSKSHLVIGKIYSNGCIHCVMMSKAWDDMLQEINDNMHLRTESRENENLSRYKKLVSPDGRSVVEVIELEQENMDKELPYVQKHYSPEIDMQGGFPTLFKVHNKKVSYYGGNRTAEDMKKWYMCEEVKRGEVKQGGKRTRRNKKNKTKKNKTRSKYSRQ